MFVDQRKRASCARNFARDARAITHVIRLFSRISISRSSIEQMALGHADRLAGLLKTHPPKLDTRRFERAYIQIRCAHVTPLPVSFEQFNSISMTRGDLSAFSANACCLITSAINVTRLSSGEIKLQIIRYKRNNCNSVAAEAQETRWV